MRLQMGQIRALILAGPSLVSHQILTCGSTDFEAAQQLFLHQFKGRRDLRTQCTTERTRFAGLASRVSQA